MADQLQPPISDENRAYMLYIPSGVFVVVLPTLVALRLWTRWQRHGRLGADDYCAILSMIFTLLLSGTLVAACHYGMGRHKIFLSSEQLYKVLQYFYMCQVFYKPAINLSKISILVLYLRIFDTVRWFRITCWFMVACVSAYCIASAITTVFQCTPVHKAFNKSIPGTCINLAKFWYANAGFSISTDVIILLLPMPLVYKLQVSTSQKVALMAVFAFGIFVVFTSCFRVTTLDIYATSPDATWDITNVMWTIIEPSTAVICANLPLLRPAICSIIPLLRSKPTSSWNDTSSSSRRAHKSTRSQVEDMENWIEISRPRADGTHTVTTQGPDSTAGSEDNILEGRPHSTSVEDGRIQKTVEYSVEYSTYSNGQDRIRNDSRSVHPS